MSDEWDRRPPQDEDTWHGREAKDFLHPPNDDPPDQPVPIDPPDSGGDAGADDE